MSFATSQPIVNRHFGKDVATAMRTHLLANAPNRNRSRLKRVAQAIARSVRVHPLHMARKMRRLNTAVQDLIN
jgi:hypothetical protein